MPVFELPHTAGCVVCGRDNPNSLALSLHVDTESGWVTAEYVSRDEHIGFTGIIHGGILALILDEAMVWAATWSGRRFCVCGELTVRYRQSVPLGRSVRVEAKIEAHRSRLIETVGSIHGDDGTLYCTASGKYVPVPPERNAEFVSTMISDPATSTTLHALRTGLNSQKEPRTK
jgi:acyl-coenzyme A thioesterase PaaI-like protein